MSFSKYVPVSFSQALSHHPVESKQKALIHLKDFFNARPDIPVSRCIDKAVNHILNGGADLRGSFQLQVIHAKVSPSDISKLKDIGFQAKDHHDYRGLNF